ncbi:MAG: ferric reductase-like transmembrane domain-containing protein [Candidatus Hydrogenedentes bacterium]|nr:ferric reductase-like transmembrane domain-containing protein [Candidatus Hydrogenedentota bacterium]
MSVTYKPIHWNRQKRIYDVTLFIALLAVMGVFTGITLWQQPYVTAETLLLRSTAFAATLLLHFILCIGALARLDARFLPLLYNRRHLGVTMFLLAAIHAIFATIQFHALGDTFPLVSLFAAYAQDTWLFSGPLPGLIHLPFEPLGFFALLILFFMAATSHDFWLRNLGASTWKLLHMGVYIAYALILGHVFYGLVQSEPSPVYSALFIGGAFLVTSLHWLAFLRERATDRAETQSQREGYVAVCKAADLQPDYGKIVLLGKSRIALFRHDGSVFALSNVCRHQGGPIGEGRILDGCVTCPWHGWQYQPHNGASPPPFNEKIATYNVRLHDSAVYVHPVANAPGAEAECARLVPETSPASPPDMPFYIGYLRKMPPALARFNRRRVAAAITLALAATAALAWSQWPLQPGRFEFGETRTLEGVLYFSPVPHLYVGGPSVLLTGTGKFGLAEAYREAEGQKVRLRGTLIHHLGQTMLEVAPADQLTLLGPPAEAEKRPASTSLGEVELTGELVDTKCFLGVMRPGSGKVHRACAIRCLSGGVPPGLWCRDALGNETVLLLAGANGAPFGYNVAWAARRITVRGMLEWHNGLPVLRVLDLKLSDA